MRSAPLRPLARAAVLALASLAAAGAAQAQSTIRPVLGFGLTGGGDRFASVEYEDGRTEDIRAGQFVYFYGGLTTELSPGVTLQGTVGYHTDSTNASNGSIKFQRFPFELLAHVQVHEQIRVGGGLRLVTGARYTESGALGSTRVSFANAVGVVGEVEYLFSPQFGLKMRYAKEDYKASFPYTGTAKGDHIGFLMSFYL
jgi:hypothetical protein